MKRKPAVWRGAIAVVAGLLGGLAGAPPASAATAHVQYLSSSSVYLDAGRDAGLAEGASVRVQRDGQVIAELLVEFVAARSAACRIASSTATIRAGDTCSFEPAAPAPVAAPIAPGASAPGAPSAGQRSSPRAWPGASAMNGSVAFLYRRSMQGDGTFSNPAVRADMRLDGANRRQLAVRIRADRPVVSIASAAGATARPERLRLYEAEVRYRAAGEKLDFAGGRFIPRGMEMVGYMDGGSAAYRPWPSLCVGVLGGRGAQPASSGFTTGGYKLGGYVEARDSRRGAPARWRALAGAALLEDPSVTRRQFVMLRSDQSFSPQVRFYENVEVDVNPGWRRVLGDPKVDLTAVSVGSQFTPYRAVDLTFGYDSRRDLRPPETRSLNTPPVALARTQGGYGAVHVRLSRWTAFRLGSDFRRRSDGTRVTRSWDATLYGSHPAVRQLHGTLHANVYDASPGRGEMYDIYLSWLAHPRLRFDLAAGAQHSRVVGDAAASIPDTRTNWLRLGTDLQLGHGMWLDATGEWRDRTGSREFYAEVGQRF